MGCFGSKINVYELQPGVRGWQCEFDALGFSEQDISKIYVKLTGNVEKKMNKIEISSIMKRLGTRNKLVQRTFEQLDNNCMGTVSFRDAVLILWNFCTLGDEVMREYVFDLYDDDSNQKLDHNEYEVMLEGILGTLSMPRGDFKDLESKINRQKQLGNTGVSRFFFVEYCGKYTSIMRPVRCIQSKLCKTTLGEKRWMELVKVRDDLMDDDYIPLPTFERGLRKGHYDSTADSDEEGVDGGQGEKASKGSRSRQNSRSSNDNNRRRESTSSANSTGGGSPAGSARGKPKRQLSGGSLRRRSLGILDIPPALDLPPHSEQGSTSMRLRKVKSSTSILEDAQISGSTKAVGAAAVHPTVARDEGTDKEGEVYATLNSQNLSRISLKHKK